MEKISNYILPENYNTIYKREAASSIALTRDVAEKLNEVIDHVNSYDAEDLKWKQTQEGIIRKGVIYMKDNLVNTLYQLLKVYDEEKVKEILLEAYGEELDLMKVIFTPQMFGAAGDGVTNDIDAIEAAIAALNEGDILFFPRGTYLMTGREVAINTKNVTFTGDGLIKCDYGFRPKASNFKAAGLNMESTLYDSNSRAFQVDNSDAADESAYIEGFTFKDCTFRNFFYAVACIGGSYSYDGTEPEILPYPVRDVVVEGCYSRTYEDKNTGHFQCIQVENIAYINNRTYGGTNASSYNAIKGNGHIRVIGNYDDGNTYAGCEIENGSGRGVVANNTFNSKIWIDDSYSVVVNANYTSEGIHITVGSNNGDGSNIIVSNNICKNIRCEQFGEYKGGIINNINIVGNTVNGINTHGIWVHGNAVIKARIANNFITGVNTNDISIQRNDQLICHIHNNFGNDHNLLIAGTGGLVFAVDNYNMTSSGTRDSMPASHLERSFNGIKIEDSNGDAWRINVSTAGELSTFKY